MELQQLASLEQILLGCTQPNTEIIRQSEALLKKQLLAPASILLLVHLCRFSTHQAARQLASVLLKVKVSTIHWTKLPGTDQEACKRLLLEAVLAEPVHQVQVCHAHAIASLAKSQLVGPGDWPQLLQLIHQATLFDSPNREIGFLLMFSMTETLASGPFPIQDFVRIFQSCLERLDTPSGVILSVLKASTAMIEFLSEEEEVLLFKPIVPLILRVLSLIPPNLDDLDESRTNTFVQAIETLTELTQSSQPVLSDTDLADLVQVLAQLVCQQAGNSALRSAATQSLVDVIGEKSRFLSKHVAARSASLAACLALCRETAIANNNSKDDNDEDEERTLPALTESLVSAYSSCLPTKLVVETLLHPAAAMIQQTAPAFEQEAGLIILIVASEGMASELIESSAYTAAFDSLFELVLRLVHPESSSGVLRHALLVLAQWAEFLWPVMEGHASRVIPLAMHFLGTENELVFAPACVVLQQYCSAMEEEEIEPFVGPILQVLFSFFAQPRARGLPGALVMMRSALETLSHVCTAGGPFFAPYFDHALGIVAPLMNLTDGDGGEEEDEAEDVVLVRSHAAQVMGQLAFVSTQCTPAGAANPFMPLVPELLGKTFSLLRTCDNLDFRESAHNLFGNVARAVGTEIEPFADAILQVLMHDCVSDDADFVVKSRTLDVTSARASALVVEEGSESDDEDGSDSGKIITAVREAAADSKASAFVALESLCEVFVNSSWGPEELRRTALSRQFHVIATELCAQTVAEYLHPGVRKCAVSLLGGVLLFAFRAEAPRPVPLRTELFALAGGTKKDADLTQKWLPGRPLDRPELFHETLGLARECVLPALADCLTCDRDRTVAAEACDTLGRILSFAGLALVSSHVDLLAEGLLALLQGKAACQRVQEVLDDDDDDEEGRRHDEVLLDSTVECLLLLCRAMGPKALSRLAPSIFPILLKRARVAMPTRDRITAVGCLANLLPLLEGGGQSLGRGVRPRLLGVAMESVKQVEDASLRRNGLVLLGALVERHEEMQFNPADALREISFVFAPQQHHKQRKFEEEDQMAVLDNACSLLARAICVSGGGSNRRALALELLKHLPLRYDHEEDWLVYSSLHGVLAELEDEVLRQAVSPIWLRAVAELLEGEEELGLGTAQCLVGLGEALVTRLGTDGVPINEFHHALRELTARRDLIVV